MLTIVNVMTNLYKCEREREVNRPEANIGVMLSILVVLLLLTFCSLLLPLWESVIVISFVVRCFVSILVLQSS